MSDAADRFSVRVRDGGGTWRTVWSGSWPPASVRDLARAHLADSIAVALFEADELIDFEVVGWAV